MPKSRDNVVAIRPTRTSTHKPGTRRPPPRTPPTIASLQQLKADPHNRRAHNPRNLAMLREALEQVGAARSIVIDEQGEILVGNGVVEAATAIGLDKVRVVEVAGDTLVAVRRTGLSPEQKRALALYDNRTAELAEWNWDQLAADQAAGLTLDPWFSPAELRLPITAGRTDPDSVPPPRPTDIQSGDLYTLGAHRVLCGDATHAGDVARVLPEARASICFTSPPYGAANVSKLRDRYIPGKRARKSFYASHDDTPRTWLALMDQWVANVRAHVDAILCNVQLLADNKRFLIEWLYVNRGDLCDVIVWDKVHGAPQMQEHVLSNAFEFVFVFGGNGSRAIPFARFHGTVSNVFRHDPRGGGNEYADVHRAVMPIALPAWVLTSLCATATSVVDPFAGTGTTMMACEQLGRSCYSIELDPTYVQVAIDRWEAFTGQQAVKVGDARRDDAEGS